MSQLLSVRLFRVSAMEKELKRQSKRKKRREQTCLNMSDDGVLPDRAIRTSVAKLALKPILSFLFYKLPESD